MRRATCEIDGRRSRVTGAMDLKRPSRVLGAANQLAGLLIGQRVPGEVERIVLVVALDHRPGVGRFQRLLQEANFPRNARHGPSSALTSYTGSLTISLSAVEP